ncbi:hypothetical protein ACWD0A_00755 [Streptomyces sp. NPDC002867]
MFTDFDSTGAERVAGQDVVRVAQPPGRLSISVPAAVNLGAAFPGSSISRQLGEVRVSDTRGRRPAVWTATVSASDFTTPGGGAVRQISRSQVSYWSGQATSTMGPGTRATGTTPPPGSRR